MFFLSKKNSPKHREIFAVTTGLYIGEFFVFMEETKDAFIFLSLPKMLVRSVPKENYFHAIKNKIISFVELLPKEIFGLCQLQYKKNKNIKTTLLPSLSG
jgi:hypothetical protein